MPVPDILNSLGVGEDGISTVYPETFVADITEAYNADMELPASRIAILEADLAAAQQEIIALKAHNYELLVSVPASEPDEIKEDQSDEDNSDDDGDDSTKGVASLFKNKEDKDN